MEKQKLHDLIDKVIGKEGPLRTPAYWMWRVLKEVVGYIMELKIWAEDAILKLESRINAILANVIKSIPKYTYAELKELKDKRLLVTGQQYMLTDYTATISLYEGKRSNLDGYVAEPYYNSSTQLVLVLTAKTIDTFNIQAKAFAKHTPDYEYDIEYHFDRSKKIAWCLSDSELDSLLVSPTGDTLDSFKLTLQYYDEGKGIVFTRPDSSDLYTINSIDPDKTSVTVNRYELDAFNNILSVVNNIELNILSYEDRYKGCITRMLDIEQCVELPFDHNITPSFSVNVHGYSTSSKGRVVHTDVRNIHVSPYIRNSMYCIPRINIQNSNVQLRGNCTHIIIDCLTSSGIDLTESSNVYLAESMPPVKARLIDVCVPNGHVYFQGPLFSRCVFIVDDANHYARCIAYQATDVNLTCTNVHAVLFLPYTNGDLVTLSLSGNKYQPIYVGMDSEGNIRQWNPADMVDMEFVVAGSLNDINKRLLESKT